MTWAPMREWSRDELLEGLEAGRTLIVQRRDDPNLPLIQSLEREGLAETRMFQIDEQSSVLKVRKAGGWDDAEAGRRAT
jgi:hypothetical protein